jgi:hypothetical protein
MGSKIVSDLVYKLTTDETGLIAGTQKANTEINKVSTTMEASGKKAEDLTQKSKVLATTTEKTTDAFSKLNGILGMAGIGLSIGAAIGFIKGAVVEFAEAEKAATTLDLALKLRGMESASKGLRDLSENLKNMGIEDDDVTLKLEAGLVASGRTEDQIKALITASAGLSSVTGERLSVSLEALNKTLEGVSPRSAELKAIMGDLTAEQLKNGEGIKRVIENYSDFIGKTGQTALSLNKMKFAFDDVTKSVGKVASENLNTAAPIVVELANAFEGLIPKMAQGYKDFLALKGVWAVIAAPLAPVSAAIKGFGGAFQIIASVVRGDLPGAFNRMGKTALVVLGGLLGPTQTVVNYAITGINKIISGLAKVTGKKASLIPEFDFFGLTDKMKAWETELDSAYAKILKNAGIAAVGFDATKSALQKAAEAAQKLADLQKENADQAKSIIDGQKNESTKLYEQYVKLAATPAANGELEKQRQEALKILSRLMEEAASKEIADADKVAQAKIDADKKVADEKINTLHENMAKDLEEYRKTKAAEVAQDEAVAENEKKLNDQKIEDAKKVADKIKEEKLAAAKSTYDSIKDLEGLLTDYLLAEIDKRQAALNAAYAQETALDLAASALKQELADLDLSITIEDEDAALAKLQEKLAAATTEEEKADIQKQIRRIELIRGIRDAEKLAADEQKELDAQKLIADKNLAIEKAKILRTQAIFGKIQAAFEIGMAIPSAIANALKIDPTGILATAVGIAAAAQLAVVAATPLPEIPTFAHGGSFIVPPGFDGDRFPIPAAMVSSGERVTVETTAQQAGGRGITLQVGSIIASPSGMRELDRVLRKYGAVETARRG